MIHENFYNLRNNPLHSGDCGLIKIHRDLANLTNMLLRETGLEIDYDRIKRLQQRHVQAYIRLSAKIQPLPGARELLAYLTGAKTP